MTASNRSTATQESASAVAVLRAEQRVHDQAAIGLMREAQKHLRAAVRLDREIVRLTVPHNEGAHAA